MTSLSYRRKFAVSGPIYTPYFNEWNASVYWRNAPFSENPWAVPASSTSGAPVIIWPGGFAGLLDESDALFSWDGETLTVATACEESLWTRTDCTPEEAWADYLKTLGYHAPTAPFGLAPEYCTWVEELWEQRHVRNAEGLPRVTEQLVERYLETIAAAGWPKGRFTIDEGWCNRGGHGGYGDWTPHRDLDLSGLAARITAAGHVPGLWLSPHLVAHDCRVAGQNPALVGEPVKMTGEADWNHYYFMADNEAAEAQAAALLHRAWEQGFRKIKFDILYGPRREMLALLRRLYRASRTVPGHLEIESHVPDPFFARYCDVVRLNDVLIGPNFPNWRQVAQSHAQVCRESAPRHILNLDHLGGNFIGVSEPEFLSHIQMLSPVLSFGYPVVSLLPEHVGEAAVEAVSALLRQCPSLEK